MSRQESGSFPAYDVQKTAMGNCIFGLRGDGLAHRDGVRK